MTGNQTKANDFAPAIVLMVMAPLLTEILPGATRLSSLFVFPIEILVWGGGALMIRAAVRRWQLGWVNMLFLALALAIAEEFLIQQTSIAPMVIRIKGLTYARAFGINYVYLLWALIYESVFVVFLPVYLVELIFPDRRDRTWVSRGGMFVLIPLFLLGCFLAWFSWTHIARPKVFHVPIFNPPVLTVLIAFAIVCGLVFSAILPFKNLPVRTFSPSKPPRPWLLFTMGALWSVFLYGLVVLGFGASPGFPPLIAVGIGIFLILAAIFFLPRWTADLRWKPFHLFILIFGIIFGSMAVGFIGFSGSSPPDLYFKIITNLLAFTGMIPLGYKIHKRANAVK